MKIEDLKARPSGKLGTDPFDTTARRALRMFSGSSAKSGSALESAGQPRTGLPDESDRKDLARMLEIHGGMETMAADFAAAELVHEAADAVQKMNEGMPPSHLSDRSVIALEAVVRERGRPAVRVYGRSLQPASDYPGSELWETLADRHVEKILAVCNATAAVVAEDRDFGAHKYVVGTAWIIGPRLAITNRHVLLPPGGGAHLVRRVPGTSTAKAKSSYALTLDFAFDDANPPADRRARIVSIPFIAADDDPVDAAIVEFESPVDFGRRLVVSDESDAPDRLFIVGHPGKVLHLDPRVAAVFGNPDERKRVSYGEKMDENEELIHDISTVGGYSGAPVLGFSAPNVRGLHYLGDPLHGNRAVRASALLAHPQLGTYLGR